MRPAPDFWYQKEPSFLAKFFTPCSKLYSFLVQNKLSAETPYVAKIPVICVGNLTVGGGGKTPAVIALHSLLQKENTAVSPVFLTRGYGSAVFSPERVDPSGDPELWGDEPLLLARAGKCVVSKNRAKGARFIEGSTTADMILMDDGMQNNQLHKDIVFAVINGTDGFGNQQVLPAGPLREPLETGLKKAGAFIIIGEDSYGLAPILPKDKPVFKARLEVHKKNNIGKNGTYVAFCGIARPERFKQTLKEMHIDVVAFKTFGDHHLFSEKDIAELFKLAQEKHAQLITTEKDFVRLPYFAKKDTVKTVPVQLVFEEPEALLDFVKHQLQ